MIFALKHNLKVNALYPARRLPKAYEAAIEGVEHVKIEPFSARRRHPGAILVVEGAAFPAATELKTLRDANVILRLRRADLPKLAVLVGRLLPRTKRINLVLADLESFGAARIWPPTAGSSRSLRRRYRRSPRAGRGRN